MYATQSFIHLDRNFYSGEEVADDDPMVALRPDLFTVDQPKDPKADKA